MYRYIISRILLVFPTLIGAAALVFLLMRLVPGDICLVRLGSGGTSFTQQALATCHAEIGIDQPWILQYLQFLWGLARFDFGISMWSGKPVILEIATRFPISLEVAVMATIIAVTIAIPLGTISALKQNSWIDLAVRSFSIAGLATPAFWLGIVSILIVLDVTQAITGQPWMPPIDYVPLWQDPIRNLIISLDLSVCPWGQIESPQLCNYETSSPLDLRTVNRTSHIVESIPFPDTEIRGPFKNG